MRTAAPFTLEERKKLEELLKFKLSMKSISKELKRTRSGLTSEVKKFFERSGCKIYNAKEADELSKRFRSNANKRKSLLTLEEKHEQVIQLRQQGYSMKEISRLVGSNYSATFRFIKENNIHAISGVSPVNLEERISSLEMQIKILTNQIKELKNDKSK